MCTTHDRDPLSQRLVEAAAHAFVALPGGTGTPTPGQPEPVESLRGELAYLLIPDRRALGVVAVARVLPDARVAAVVRPTTPTVDCAAAVTGVASAAAHAAAADIAHRNGGTLDSGPRLVHDGPIGREAWLIVVTLPDDSRRWVFLTGGGTYARAAGQPPAGGIV